MRDLDRLRQEHLIVDELARRGHRPTRKYGPQWDYHCPFPEHEDSTPSFKVHTERNTWRCYGCDRGGSIIDLVAALDGREPKDVISELTGGGGERVHTPSRNGATVQRYPGCTLEALAAKCRLPVEHLKFFGLTDMNYMGAPAVRIPYLGMDGNELAVQYRVALEKTDANDRFKWKKGSKPTLYGWRSLLDAQAAGYVIIPEGASDYWSLRYHGFPALALPAAAGWKEEYADALADVTTIYVVIEPDQGGQTVRDLFKTSQLRDRVKLIYMSEEAKDPGELHKQDPDSFRASFAKLMIDAIPLAHELREEVSAEAAEAWGQCRRLALEPRILDHFIVSLHGRRVAGEGRLCKLLYLSLCSRYLKRPVSVAVKGPSSGGKSYIIEQVLAYFPPLAYFTLSAMSEHAIAYMEEPLSHRFLVIFEAAGMSGDTATYLIRSLLSEGCIRYATVEKTSEGLRDRVIEREGPTGLIVTTTRASLHPENETRLLSLTVTDTPEQTRSVLLAIADETDDERGDELGVWQALQTWLDLAGEHRVTVPFSRDLAELIPPVAVRLRRDFSTVLNLVRAHALLHQASRARDNQGRIIATVDDYAVVRDLVADLVADEVGATVSEATREAVRAVCQLHEQGGEAASNKLVAERLGIDPASGSRRLKVAAAKGYLRNLETRPGVAAKWIPGETLPDDQELLPPPNALYRCTVAPLREGIEHPPSPLTEKVLV